MCLCRKKLRKSYGTQIEEDFIATSTLMEDAGVGAGDWNNSSAIYCSSASEISGRRELRVV